MIRVWHDDHVEPPDGFHYWVMTNSAAKVALGNMQVDEISLCETGLDLVRWMLHNKLVPPTVTIHSWNVPGAKQMADELRSAGYSATQQRIESD